MQTVKNRQALFEFFVVIAATCSDSANNRVHAACFRTIVFIVFKVNIVNYFSDLPERRIRVQTETFYQRFKRAVFALMREVRADHIKSNRAVNRFAFRDKAETRATVNESFNQPSGRHAVNMRIFSRHPPLILIFGNA